MPGPAVSGNFVWAGLYAIIGLLIVLQLIPYLERRTTEKTDPSSLTTVERQLQLLVAGKSLGSGLGEVGGSFDDLADSVRRDAPRSLRGDHLYAALRYEAGDKRLEAKDLPNLAADKAAKSKALLQIYTAEKPDKALIARAEASLKGKGFLDRLSLAQAKERAGVPNARDGLVDPSATFRVLGANVALFFGLGLGVLILLWWLLIGRHGTVRGFSGLHKVDRQDLRSVLLAGRSVQCLGIYLLISIFGAILVAPIALSGAGGQRVATVLVYAMMLAATLLLFKLPVLGHRLRLGDIGWERIRGWHVAYGIGAAIANAPLVLIASVAGQKMFDFLPTPEHPVTDQLASRAGGLFGILAIFFLACVVAPITEEIMFRGTMAPAMARKYGSTFAGIVISSLFFAAIHPTGIPAWPALAMVGATSAYLSYRTGSLMPSVVMHSFHNFCTLCLSLLIL